MVQSEYKKGIPFLKKIRETLEATRGSLLKQIEADQRKIRQLQKEQQTKGPNG